MLFFLIQFASLDIERTLAHQRLRTASHVLARQHCSAAHAYERRLHGDKRARMSACRRQSSHPAQQAKHSSKIFLWESKKKCVWTLHAALRNA
ncbi:hypothetical protein CWB41_09970 [Methylovirgula ligni]|nr:hypothetical protein CWB41_09970 [Methylovirgula ligni]